MAGCVKTMNIQYHMIAAAAHIDSLGKMRLVHAFIQLYVNELADMLHMFNIEFKHVGNISLFLQQSKHS